MKDYFFHLESFLARNSVAVDPAFAKCTNRCTRRKVTVNARPTKRENRKQKKTRRHKNPHTSREKESECSFHHPNSVENHWISQENCNRRAQEKLRKFLRNALHGPCSEFCTESTNMSACQAVAVRRPSEVGKRHQNEWSLVMITIVSVSFISEPAEVSEKSFFLYLSSKRSLRNPALATRHSPAIWPSPFSTHCSPHPQYTNAHGP